MKNLKYLLLMIGSALGYWMIFPVQAQDLNQVGLIVQFDDATISTYCISFTGDSISGYDVLQQSGLEVLAAFDPMGAALCKIAGAGCSVDNCFCQFPPNYWSYWHMSNNNWSYSQQGASNYQVQDGGIEGWRWGKGEPPTVNYAFDEICKPATETSTATPTETNTPIPVVTTSQPTETSDLIDDEGTDGDSTPFTVYYENFSENQAIQSPTWTPTSTMVITTSNAPIDFQTLTPTIQSEITNTPSPTQKIKATSLRATRQAKKTQESLQKTMENISTPTVLIIPSATETPDVTTPNNQGIIKFLIALFLLITLAILGSWQLKKRGQTLNH